MIAQWLPQVAAVKHLEGFLYLRTEFLPTWPSLKNNWAASVLTGKIFLFAQKWEVENYSPKGNESENHYLNSGFVAENIFQPQLKKKK